MGWNPTGWQPEPWQPPNWQPPVHTEPVAPVADRAAFLDRFGRFAKRDEDVAEVRVWAIGAAALDYTSYTVAQFEALTPAARLAIEELGSGAGLVVTEGKSNA